MILYNCLLKKEVIIMEIILYILENIIFPLLVATLEIYIIRYIDKRSKNNKRQGAVAE